MNRWDWYEEQGNTMGFKLTLPGAKQPYTARITDAGYDLFSPIDVVVPGLFRIENTTATKIDTGVQLEVPVGYYVQIADRSSMGSKLVHCLGGIVDSSYRGNLIVCLANLSFYDYQIKTGDRIAQFLVIPIYKPELVQLNNLSQTDRSDGAFGSSGI